jgi:hypothetical protein
MHPVTYACHLGMLPDLARAFPQVPRELCAPQAFYQGSSHLHIQPYVQILPVCLSHQHSSLQSSHASMRGQSMQTSGSQQWFDMCPVHQAKVLQNDTKAFFSFSPSSSQEGTVGFSRG